MLDGATREHARASRLQDVSRQRVDAGLDNQLQLRQSESTIAAARQQAQAAQQQIDALRNALAALLGKGPDRGLDITLPQLLAAPSPGVPEVFPNELLAHRADGVHALWRGAAARRQTAARQAALLHSINLNPRLGLAPPALVDFST